MRDLIATLPQEFQQEATVVLGLVGINSQYFEFRRLQSASTTGDGTIFSVALIEVVGRAARDLRQKVPTSETMQGLVALEVIRQIATSRTNLPPLPTATADAEACEISK